MIKCTFEYGKMLSRSDRFIVNSNADPKYIFEISHQELTNRMLKYPNMSVDQNEVVSSAQLFFEKALKHHRLLLHAVALVIDGEAFLFFAPPSGGKTTMANNWKMLLGERVSIIADDSPVIGIKARGTCIWNSCWSKTTEELSPNKYPLKGIGIICKSKTNSVVPITANQAVQEIIIGYPKGDCRTAAKELLINAFLNIKCWQCCCDESQDAARLAIENMVR